MDEMNEEDKSNVVEEASDSTEYMELDMEVNEDDIVAILVDEDDNEIGFTMLDEDGNEVEYFYVDDDDEEPAKRNDKLYEGAEMATQNMNAIYKEGAALTGEFKGAFDDIKAALDFKSMFK